MRMESSHMAMGLRVTISVIPSLIMAVSCGNDREEWIRPENGGSGNGENKEVRTYADKAKELYGAIETYYLIGSGTHAGLYNESFPKGSEPSSYLWPYDGLVSGAAGLNALGYDVGYKAKVDNFERYWRNSGVTASGGYGSSTNGRNGGGDRFFDDNSIVGLNLVEAYRQTRDDKYMERALRIVDFLQSGKDEVFGGGLWWNESWMNVPGREDSNKPACANAYAAWFLTSLYESCPAANKPEVLSLAKDLYSWVRNNLRDDDGCYFNSKGADGVVNRTKWTYNSGAMIAAGVRLHRITGEASYLADAKATADGSYSYFVKARNGLNRAYPTNDPWLTIKLIRSYIELEPYHTRCKDYIKTFITFTDYALDHGRMTNGLFLEDWTGVTVNPERDKSLLMQDAALESLTTIAIYNDEKPGI